VTKVREAEAARVPGTTALAEAVARYDFKLRAIKDEYEVARLYAQTDFLARVDAQFEGDYKLTFHLAPPLTNKPDPHTGRVKKSQYGPWMMKAFRVLAKLKGLRGTPFDVFGRTAERRMERKLLADYEIQIDELLAKLSPSNHALAVSIASLPESIRGYGHVKDKFVAEVKAQEAELVAQWRSPTIPITPLRAEKVAA
jgi:indolepyruvate ferredoxin oxidoreductase